MPYKIHWNYNRKRWHGFFTHEERIQGIEGKMDEKQEPAKRNVTSDGHNNQLTKERKRGSTGTGFYRVFVTT
jgi:hypothetical protein